MAGTFSDSWRITKRAFGMIGETPGMLVFPLVAGVTVIATFLLFVGGTFWLPGLLLGPATSGGFSSAQQALALVLFVAAYFVSNFVGVYTTAGLIGVASLRLAGRPATPADGWRIARQNLRRLLIWSLTAATIGLLIQLVSSRFRGLAGLVLRVAAGATWGIVTYFMVPVLLFEHEGNWASLKRSAHLFLDTFGRTIVTNLVVRLIVAVGVFAAVILVFLGLFSLLSGAVLTGLLVIAAGVSIGIILALIGSAAEGVVRAALYRYATTGQVDSGWVPSDYRGTGALGVR